MFMPSWVSNNITNYVGIVLKRRRCSIFYKADEEYHDNYGIIVVAINNSLLDLEKIPIVPGDIYAQK
ncbi:MAG: hypothetical protein U0V18_05125 [Anaerolineales bacterium]